MRCWRPARERMKQLRCKQWIALRKSDLPPCCLSLLPFVTTILPVVKTRINRRFNAPDKLPDLLSVRQSLESCEPQIPDTGADGELRRRL